MKTTKTKELAKYAYVSSYAKELLKDVPEEFELSDTELKVVKLSELGFPNGAMTKEFLNNEFLAKHGLALCEPQDIFKLDVNRTDLVILGMKPIKDSDGDPSLLGSGRSDDGRWLRTFCDYPDGGWNDGGGFAFCVKQVSALKTSDPKNSLSLSPLSLENFFNKVKKGTNEKDCWLWTGSKDKYGYGSFGIRGKTQKTHRVAYNMEYGSIIKNMVVHHECGVTVCVNPKHLKLVTHEDNTRIKNGITTKNPRKLKILALAERVDALEADMKKIRKFLII